MKRCNRSVETRTVYIGRRCKQASSSLTPQHRIDRRVSTTRCSPGHALLSVSALILELAQPLYRTSYRHSSHSFSLQTLSALRSIPPGSVVQKCFISISAGRYIFLAHYPPIDQNFFQNLLAQTIGLLYITPCAETRTLNGRLAQGESASLTRKRSQVQILYRPPTVIRPLDFQWPVFYQYPHPRSTSRRYRTRQTNAPNECIPKSGPQPK